MSVFDTGCQDEKIASSPSPQTAEGHYNSEGILERNSVLPTIFSYRKHVLQ